MKETKGERESETKKGRIRLTLPWPTVFHTRGLCLEVGLLIALCIRFPSESIDGGK